MSTTSFRISAGLGLLILLSLALLGAGGMLKAQEAPARDEIAAGTLLLHPRGGGADLPAVRLGTHVEVDISGMVARTRVVQAFRNTGKGWAAATYLYPLPEDGAVDSLKMVVGQRVIVGEIKRRAEASAAYEQAKAAGQKAALVEQQRPNMFTSKVANVAPGETVLIEIQYQAPVVHKGGDYQLRLPLVVGPRYVPPHTITNAGAAADAGAVTAPLLDPKHGKINPVSIEVRLRPGFPVANLISPSHKIAIEQTPDGGQVIRLEEGEEPADRDFVLGWRSAAADTTIGLFRERLGDADYGMAVLTPPVDDVKRLAPPRELVFVIDNSGSMAGESMVQAKTSLLRALETLKPEDRFNVIRFDDTMTELFERPVSATAEQVALAVRFTNGLEATGGTEMLPALKEALVDDTPGDDARVRQVIFLTDGAISNEAEMISALSAARGRSRVFMVGIGSAPNTYLMSHMAEVGRGSFTHIGDTATVDARMAELLDRLTRPAVTDLQVRLVGGAGEITPATLPDLYAGEPLVILARAGKLSGTLEVSGRIGDRSWSQTVELSTAGDGPGVARLWARRKVAETEVAERLGTVNAATAAEAIAQLGLRFGMVTRETSLVAIDRTPSRPANARLTEEELPLNLPKGWDFDALFGGNLSTAQGGDVGTAEAGEAFELPQTATEAGRLFQSGLALILVALLGLAALRRKPACA